MSGGIGDNQPVVRIEKEKAPAFHEDQIEKQGLCKTGNARFLVLF